MIDDKTQIEMNGYIVERGVISLRKLEHIKRALRKKHPMASKKQIDNWIRYILERGR